MITQPQASVVTTDDLADGLRLGWNEALAGSPTRSIFMTLEWQRAWWATFGAGRLIVVAQRAGAEIAIAPMYAHEGMLFFVGSGGSDYLDFLGRPSAEAMAGLLRHTIELCPDFVGIRLYHVPDSSPTGEMLEGVAERLGLRLFDEGGLPAPLLDAGNGEALETAANKKSLVRHERGLQRSGALEVVHETEPDAIHPYLDAFFEQHVQRWDATPYPSLFLEQKQRRFYRSIVDEVGPTGRIRFTRVSLDGRPIAFHFGMSYGGSFLWYKPTFDIALAKHSPGEVLMRNLLIRAKAEGALVFDLGLGDEPFKARFASRTPWVKTWGLYPPSED